jgi:AcrR family transcriptional regulator
MGSTGKPAYQPRKTPTQRRSIVTVEAIYEATSQVLIESGLEQFSTDRVARRAGVSIGTLYQYFPNKETLVYALLERYLDARDDAVEDACHRLAGNSYEVLMTEVVTAYVDTKLRNVNLAVALYNASLETGASSIVKRTSGRCCAALSRALAQSTGFPETDTNFLALMLFNSIGETTRAVVRLGATASQIAELRRQLSLLCCSYVQKWLAEQATQASTHP